MKLVQSTFWQIKYWQISQACIHIPMHDYIIGGSNIGDLIKNANRQSLLLANISFYTVPNISMDLVRSFRPVLKLALFLLSFGIHYLENRMTMITSTYDRPATFLAS